jgi:hypothetical protein
MRQRLQQDAKHLIRQEDFRSGKAADFQAK